MMNHEEIRKALENGPTPGPWYTADWSNDFGENKTTIEAQEQEVLHPGQSSIWPRGIAKKCVAETEYGERPLVDAAYIAACNPQAIAALLEDRDKLAEALAALQESRDV